MPMKAFFAAPPRGSPPSIPQAKGSVRWITVPVERSSSAMFCSSLGHSWGIRWASTIIYILYNIIYIYMSTYMNDEYVYDMYMYIHIYRYISITYIDILVLLMVYMIYIYICHEMWCTKTTISICKLNTCKSKTKNEISSMDHVFFRINKRMVVGKPTCFMYFINWAMF